MRKYHDQILKFKTEKKAQEFLEIIQERKPLEFTDLKDDRGEAGQAQGNWRVLCNAIDELDVFKPSLTWMQEVHLKKHGDDD